MKSIEQIETRYKHVKQSYDKIVNKEKLNEQLFYITFGEMTALEWVLNEERRPLCID